MGVCNVGGMLKKTKQTLHRAAKERTLWIAMNTRFEGIRHEDEDEQTLIYMTFVLCN